MFHGLQKVQKFTFLSKTSKSGEISSKTPKNYIQSKICNRYFYEK